MLPMHPIDFIARLVNKDGVCYGGTFKAQFDDAEYLAQYAFPDCEIRTVYPQDEGWRLVWTQQKIFRRSHVE